MHVLVRATWDPDLDDARDAGVVHPTRGDVRSDQDRCAPFRIAELVRNGSARVLCAFGVYLEDVSVSTSRETGRCEDFDECREELRHPCGGEENDDFGGAGVFELVVSEKAEDVWDLVTGRGEGGVVLWDVLVHGGIFLSDAVDVLVIRGECRYGNLLDCSGDSCGEEEGLALGCRG